MQRQQPQQQRIPTASERLNYFNGSRGNSMGINNQITLPGSPSAVRGTGNTITSPYKYAPQGLQNPKDMDVQRLVDVLWSQDIDLGAGRETFEYPIHPRPKDVRVGQKADPKLDTFPANAGRFPYTATDSSGEGFERFLIDDETGEVTPRTGAGNDSRDPFSVAPPANVTQFYPTPANYGSQNATSASAAGLNTGAQSAGNASTSRVPNEDQQLQSLIEALNSLNSSTLQAAVNQGQNLTGKSVEEQWQDVESVIDNSHLLGLGGNVNQFNNVTPSRNSYGLSAPPVSSAGLNATQQQQQQQTNGSVDLSTFDLFSMFMDPPKNWTLPTANSNPNVSEYFGCLPNNTFGNNYGQANGVVPNGSQSVDMFGMSTRTASQQQTLPSLVHEGPFDFSAFSYAQPPLVPQQQPQPDSPYSSVPMLDTTNGTVGGYAHNWNLSDWHGVGVDMNGFQQSQQAPNASSTFYTPSSNSGAWKLLQEFPPHVPANISEAFLLLDPEAKLDVQDLDSNSSSTVSEPKLVPVREIKQEEPDVEDPWTEHVNYAAGHNHTYSAGGHMARRRGRDHESREGSEDDRKSFSGSTGSGSGTASTGARPGGRSRQSRDDRAASELRLPVTAEEIIAMPVEEFNGYITGQAAQLHHDQIQLMKDIRRRGKNKVAAQNCRRRKIDNMSHLEREIMELQKELKAAQLHHEEVTRERERYRAAIRNSGGVVEPPTSTATAPNLPLSPSSVPTSVIVMSGGSVTRRPDTGSSSEAGKPLRKRKREE